MHPMQLADCASFGLERRGSVKHLLLQQHAKHRTSLDVTQCLCTAQQANANYTGSPDTDSNPTFTLYNQYLQIYSNHMTVTLPPVSISICVF